MGEEFDPNVIAAEFLKQNLDSIANSAKGVIQGASDNIRLHLASTYKSYIIDITNKYSKAKSFLLRGEPEQLYDFYVPLDLIFKKSKLTSPKFSDLKHRSNFSVITGTAGCGKSMFVRHILLDSLISKLSVPIFVELRQFNTFPDDLIKLIHKTLVTNKFNIGDEYIQKALNKGHFTIILDGYDEVPPSKRFVVSRYINDFTKRYEKNVVIVTSRPDPELEGWQLFSLFQIAPLDIVKANELIRKLPFDDVIKGKFIKDLPGLFEKHRSFLSNPLLLSIMLLTYGQSASIPNKLSIFYNQAYEALFERHDTLKEGYKRELQSSLDIQEFSRIFSAFCIQSYDKTEISFTKTQALEYIIRAQNIVGVKCEADKFLKDLIQSVCLLVQDGLEIVYTHRSFQEYFTAKFIIHSILDVQSQLLMKYSKMTRSDYVFDMINEMRPDIIESVYIIPALNILFKEIGLKKTLGVSNHEKYIKASYTRFHISQDGRIHGIRTKDNGFFDTIAYVISRFGHIVNLKYTYTWGSIDKIAVEKYKTLHGDGNGDLVINLTNNKLSKQFIRDLVDSRGIFSLEVLKLLLKIKNKLEDKLKLKEKSLEDILSIKSS